MVTLRGVLALAVVGVATGFCGASWAASSATLDTLDGGVGSITQGNATYSDFSYGGTTLDSTVLATASTDGSGNSVITFSRASGTWTVGDGNSVITFHVDFTTPMSQTLLDFTATATGNVVSSVGETVNDGLPHGLQVFIDPIVPSQQLTDLYTFAAPVTSLDVVKSIDIANGALPPGDVVSDSEVDTGTITSVDNVFLPGPGSGTPEPGTVALLGLGILGLMWRRRRWV